MMSRISLVPNTMQTWVMTLLHFFGRKSRPSLFGRMLESHKYTSRVFIKYFKLATLLTSLIEKNVQILHCANNLHKRDMFSETETSWTVCKIWLHDVFFIKVKIVLGGLGYDWLWLWLVMIVIGYDCDWLWLWMVLSINTEQGWNCDAKQAAQKKRGQLLESKNNSKK